ncbi:MAG: type II toxin-antitoxin system prevent-host-death family antitoxin [Gemmatimonadetes bacterium]|nr:type II toxin-antitoxin system prevent-host-death family antitoxin [Gemmatimonadota bacterium]
MTRPKIFNLYEAKTHLSKLVDDAAAGAEIVIAKSGKAKARLVPLEAPLRARRPGGWEGRIRIADDFDDELPPSVLAGFLGEDDSE